MRAILFSLVSVMILTFSASMALAATAKCSVVEITEKTVVLDCGDCGAILEKIKVGDKVKVKTVKKKKAIEGC